MKYLFETLLPYWYLDNFKTFAVNYNIITPKYLGRLSSNNVLPV